MRIRSIEMAKDEQTKSSFPDPLTGQHQKRKSLETCAIEAYDSKQNKKMSKKPKKRGKHKRKKSW